MNQPNSNINLDKIRETLLRGVRRADIFIGLGINAARHDPPISHVLSADTGYHIQLSPENISDEQSQEIMHEFEKWVTGSGLRQLFEVFSHFLLQIYSIVFFIHKTKNHEGNLCGPRKFEQWGIGEQLKYLSGKIEIPEAYLKNIRSLNQMRNCYTHRFGIVGRHDVDKTTQLLSIFWSTFSPEVQQPDGTKLVDEEIFGTRLEAGGVVQFRDVVREKHFKIGEEIVIRRQEMKEIILFIHFTGELIFKKMVELAEKSDLLKRL